MKNKIKSALILFTMGTSTLWSSHTAPLYYDNAPYEAIALSKNIISHALDIHGCVYINDTEYTVRLACTQPNIYQQWRGLSHHIPMTFYGHTHGIWQYHFGAFAFSRNPIDLNSSLQIIMTPLEFSSDSDVSDEVSWDSSQADFSTDGTIEEFSLQDNSNDMTMEYSFNEDSLSDATDETPSQEDFL